MENLSEISSDTIKEVLMEVVENLLGTPNFHVSLAPGSKKGDNFGGIVYRIMFNRIDEKKKRSLFLKIAPSDDVHRVKLFARAIFIAEMFVYNEIFPCFREFQKSKGILIDEDGFHEYPKCYQTIDAEPIETLFLEDLCEQNFRMVNLRSEELTVEHVKLVMQVLGKFHACSFALKDQQPEKFQKLASNLTEVLFNPENAGIALYMNCLPKTLFDSITDDKDAHLLLHLVRLFERNQFDMGIECVDATLAEPYAVITHGDSWSNNWLYQYTPELTQAYFVDFQVARYSSPVCDVAHFIFTATTKEQRDQHYDNFLRTYHESLSLQMVRLGSDPEKVFPYQTFLKQMRKFGKYGLILAVFMMQIIGADEVKESDDLAKDLTEGKNITDGLKTSKKAKQQLRDIVDDMVRLKYI